MKTNTFFKSLRFAPDRSLEHSVDVSSSSVALNPKTEHKLFQFFYLQKKTKKHLKTVSPFSFTLQPSSSLFLVGLQILVVIWRDVKRLKGYKHLCKELCAFRYTPNTHLSICLATDAGILSYSSVKSQGCTPDVFWKDYRQKVEVLKPPCQSSHCSVPLQIHSVAPIRSHMPISAEGVWKILHYCLMTNYILIFSKKWRQNTCSTWVWWENEH